MKTETGENGEKVSMPELERVIRDANEPVTAVELSSKLPLTNTQVNRKLKTLAERDKIERKKVGSAAVVYWHRDCF